VARWTGTWLEGPGATLREIRHPDSWPGQRLGLPREGSTAVATFSGRVLAFVLDIAAAGLIGALITSQLEKPSDVVRQAVPIAVLFLEHVLLVGLTGQTLGMRVMSIKVLRLKDVTRVPGFPTALARSIVLIGTFGLAGFCGRDGRGVHDLVFGCVVVRD
jgi:uncharacterized RDD family membrane protein YckC